METERCGVCNSLGAFLIGGALGAAAGILFAPKSGKETREELRQTAGKTVEEARHFYSETMAKADAILEEARRKADKLRKEADRQLQEVCQRAGRVVAGAGRAERTEKEPANTTESAKETVEGMA